MNKMNKINRDQAIIMLELLRNNSSTHIDYIVLWADTMYENKVMYNPNMPHVSNSGRWEFINTDGVLEYYTRGIDDASYYIMTQDEALKDDYHELIQSRNK